ncbi:MAG: hypothetical protein P4L99_18085 [Chthoniobacter sp.]|nr:hypothetical protein [Chthoniobacter sp.]
MKIYPVLLLFLLTTGPLLAQNQPPATPAPPLGATPKNDAAAALAILQKPYHAAMAGIAAENQKWLASAESWYLASLEKMQTDYTKAGDLDSAVAVKAERERIAAHGETTPEQIQAMPAAVRTLRGTYDASSKKMADDVDRRKAQEGQKYRAGLEALLKRITATGDLDQALLVKTEEERIAAEIAAVTHAPPSAPAPATPPPPTATPSLLSKLDAGTPKASDRMEALIGTWRFTYQSGWSGRRTFSKSGTFFGEGFKGTARWTVAGDKILLHYPTKDKTVEEMSLPIDPAGTKVMNGRFVVNAVKEGK